jgi:hypothetical protein
MTKKQGREDGGYITETESLLITGLRRRVLEMYAWLCSISLAEYEKNIYEKDGR